MQFIIKKLSNLVIANKIKDFVWQSKKTSVIPCLTRHIVSVIPHSKLHIIILFISIFFIPSCEKHNVEKHYTTAKLIPIDTLIIDSNIDFNYNYFYAHGMFGSYYDSISNVDYLIYEHHRGRYNFVDTLYFFDYKKNIITFKIPIPKNCRVYEYNIHNLDSIFVINQYESVLYLIGKDGNIKKE